MRYMHVYYISILLDIAIMFVCIELYLMFWTLLCVHIYTYVICVNRYWYRYRRNTTQAMWWRSWERRGGEEQQTQDAFLGWMSKLLDGLFGKQEFTDSSNRWINLKIHFLSKKGLLSDIRQHQVTSPFVAGELSLFVTKWLTPPFQKPGVGVKRRVFEACLMTFWRKLWRSSRWVVRIKPWWMWP